MPRYGPKILGAEEFKRQQQNEIGGRSLYGSKVVEYVPHTAEKPADPTNVEWPIPIRGMKAHLAAHSHDAPAAARAELDSDAPRKSALKFLLDVGLDDELHKEAVEALKAMED